MVFQKGLHVKRLAIFFFYDKDGIVDNYILYFLKDLKNNVDELLIVCNGFLNNNSENDLKNITSNIIVRENKGFDVWAYKAGIERYGWDKISCYDELILCNFTLFGPLYPFKYMFEEMNEKDLDFWGITKHHKVDFDSFGTCKYNYIPEHIQSSFLVIRKSLIRTKDYQNFWDNIPMINSYADSVGYYEAIFTKDFKDKGYKEDVFVNTEDLREHTRYPLLMMSYELVKNRKCPVIKRKSFSQSYYDMLSETIGQSTLELYDYIRNNTNYDINLIWDSILREYNMYDIKNIMHLNYILPKEVLLVSEGKVNKNSKIAIIIHLYFKDLIKYISEYVAHIPKYMDVYITTDTEEKKNLIQEEFDKLKFNKLQIILIQNRGRDVSALLVGTKNFIMNYDYVCFVHDKKTTQIKPYCIGEGFSYKCFENVLGSDKFIQNVITTFEDNPRLGLLTPPPPNHSSFYQTLYSSWANNYKNTCKLAKKLNLNVNIHWSCEPIAPLGTMFWFRPKAMKKLFDENWEYDDFPEEPNSYDGTLLHAIERIYPYIVQDAGYYNAWIMSDKFSRVEITNLYFMLRENIKCNANKDTDIFLSTNNDFLLELPLKKVLKVKLKNKLPSNLWNVIKKLYHLIKK